MVRRAQPADAVAEGRLSELGYSDPLLRAILRAVAGLGGVACAVIAVLRGLSTQALDLNIALNGSFVVVCALALALTAKNRWLLASRLILWGGWILTAAFVALNGGTRSINLMNFLILIQAAGWMAHRRTVRLMGIATGVVLAALMFAEAQGWIAPPPPRSRLLVGVYAGVIVGLCALMAVQSREHYRRMLSREHALAQEARLLSLVAEQSPAGVLITDPAHRIEYVNAVAARQLRGDPAALLGADAARLAGTQFGAARLAEVRAALAAGKSWQGEVEGRRRDGTAFIDSMIVTPVHAADGRTTHYAWTRLDITERQRAKQQLQYLSHHDALTGLESRQRLEQRLATAMQQAHEGGALFALLLLNVDRFRQLNEARGQRACDELLRALGRRLERVCGESRPLARLSGDEFAVLLPTRETESAAACRRALAFAARLQGAVVHPLRLPPDDRLVLSLSIGVSLFPHGKQDQPGQALQRALTTLIQAKALGGGQTLFFDRSMADVAARRFAIERDLREAVARGELRLYLQPQVDIRGTLVGAEALVRWQHPHEGLLLPHAFIPIAEESNLIVAVGDWVLTEAVRLIGEEARAGRALPLSVNISPRQFREADFVDCCAALLAAHELPAGLLTLEVTEGLMIDDLDTTVERMQAVRALGVHFSLDDFGTGYSSLAHLKRLPVAELKIDRAFVHDASRRPEDAVLVQTIMAVGRQMGMKVVAEGVETEVEADFLARHDAAVILQGYLHGRPAPAAEWLARWRAEAALPALPAQSRRGVPEAVRRDRQAPTSGSARAPADAEVAQPGREYLPVTAVVPARAQDGTRQHRALSPTTWSGRRRREADGAQDLERGQIPCA